jgi:DNA-binding NtrC family response regulator
MSSDKKAGRKPPKKSRGGPRTYGRLQRALDDAARREIEAALKETGGNVSEAARVLGVHRVSLLKRMGTLGVDPNAHR